MQIASLSTANFHIETSKLVDSLDRSERALPYFFFSSKAITLTTLYIASRFTRRISTVLSAIVHTISRKIEAVFTLCVERVLSWVIQDREFAKKISDENAFLYQKTSSSMYGQTAHVLASFVSSYLDHYLEMATKVSPETRPQWLSSLIDKTEERYNWKGRVISSCARQNKELLLQVLELNFLKMFSRLIDRLQAVQSKHHFAFLDLIRETLMKASGHFSKCHTHESEMANARRQRKPLIDETDKKQEQTQLFKILSESFFNIVLPNGKGDLELPLSDVVTSYVSDTLFAMLKDEILPNVFEKIFSILCTKYTKDMILLEGFQLLHEVIDEDYKPSAEVIYYPEQESLNEAFYECLVSILNYVAPSPLPKVLMSVAPKKIAEAASEAISEYLQVVTLECLLELGLEKLVPLLNPGGRWEETSRGKEFAIASFTFEVTQEEKEHSLRMAQEKEAELRALIDKIGKESKGLTQLLQNKVFAVTPIALLPEEEPTSSWLSFALTKIQSGYRCLSEKLVTGSCHLTGISQKVHALNVSLFKKIHQPEHEELYFGIAENLIKAFGEKVSFPERRIHVVNQTDILPHR